MGPERAGAEQGAGTPPAIACISAVSLATHDMARAVRFYRALGFSVRYGGEASCFTSFHAGPGYLNLIAQPAERQWSWWGRVIFYVTDVDAFYARAVTAGLMPDGAPRDAPWGERYFHLTDPDGHELSFATPLPSTRTPPACTG
jgi:catechol 2,3-dioxygenase-like lactoylglutathione lyase family enzyme